MLYKFKSRAAADLIMLEAHGRQMLQIMGKSVDEPHGIVTVAQIPAAIEALQAAVQRDEAQRAKSGKTDEGDDEDARDADEEGSQSARDTVSLRRRAAPFIEMLRRSLAEEADVVW